MSGKTLEKENIMGTARMSRLIITTGLPLMASFLINSLYNFVDSVFVARISEQALTAPSSEHAWLGRGSPLAANPG